jgi:hypothetical protein
MITLKEVHIFTEYYGHSKQCSGPNFPLYDLEFLLRKQLSIKLETLTRINFELTKVENFNKEPSLKTVRWRQKRRCELLYTEALNNL